MNMDISTIVVNSPAMPQPQDDSLGKLPLELLRQAFERLPAADIKSVRLLNKRYNEVASPYLMPRVYLAARPKTIAVFKEVIGHAVFSTTIREIIFDASIFADGTYSSILSPAEIYGITEQDLEENTDAEMEAPFDELEENEVDEHRKWLAQEPESSERTQALEHYHTMIAEQESILEHREDLRCLEHAGKVLPKLQSICYTDWYHIEARSSDWYSKRGPLSWDLLPMTCPPFYNDNNLITRAAVVTRSLSSVLEYVLRGGATIDSLTLDIGGRPEFQILGMLNRNQNNSTNLMPNITHLDLTFGASAADTKEGSSNPLKMYARMLAQTTNLRSLHLHTTNSIWALGGPYPHTISVHAINRYLLPKISLPYLHTLELKGGFYVTPDLLIHLLARHAATLQDLRLHYICLIGENALWPDVFQRMRDTLQGVKVVVLNFLYGADDEDEVRGWSYACAEQRRLIELFCDWIVGNGEMDDGERERFENWKCNWEGLAKTGDEVQSVDHDGD